MWCVCVCLVLASNLINEIPRRHACLCNPPAMREGCIELRLIERGVVVSKGPDWVCVIH